MSKFNELYNELKSLNLLNDDVSFALGEKKFPKETAIERFWDLALSLLSSYPCRKHLTE